MLEIYGSDYDNWKLNPPNAGKYYKKEEGDYEDYGDEPTCTRGVEKYKECSTSHWENEGGACKKNKAQ